MTSTTTSQFPLLSFPSDPVNPSQYVEKGTAGAKILAYLVAGFLMLILTAATYGVLLFVLLIGVLVEYFHQKRLVAQLKGSAIEVGPEQFPQIHACAEEFARRLGLQPAPVIYVATGPHRNAFARRIGHRKFIVLIEDVLDGCLRSDDPRTLGFIIAHEMAHHALGHTNRIQAYIAQAYKKLMRLNEFSCDAVAGALVAEPRIAARGLVVLLAGPHLLPYVNFAAIERQAQEVAADQNSVKAEKKLSHPLLLRRVQRFLA